MSYLGNPPVVQATRTLSEFVATSGQTIFTPPGGYQVGYVDVIVNGAMLQQSDFTATDGSTVVLASACSLLDDVRVIALGTFQIANATPADGSVTTAKLAAAAVTQAKLGANVAGNGPTFWAYPASDATISSATDVVIANAAEVYDTASCFNNTGATVGGIPAYSFLPNVAGFYLITSTINTELSTAPSRFINSVRLNGATSYRVVDTSVAYAPSVSTGSFLVFLNGTTDYVQQVIYLAATTPRYSSNPTTTRFSGVLLRAA